MTPDPWQAFISNHKVGDTVRGKITKLAEFGAFVEVAEGVEGLAHVSAMPPDAPDVLQDAAAAGQLLDFCVLSVDVEKQHLRLSPPLSPMDGENQRVSIAMKQTAWKAFAETHVSGDIVSGRITRLVEFGAFVEVAEGVEGLVHVSEMPPDAPDVLQDAVAMGQILNVRVLSVDVEKQRLRLSLRLRESPSA